MKMNLIKRISNCVSGIYSVPLMLALLIAVCGFFWVFNFSSLPLSNPELIKLSGREGLLDLRPYYSPQEAYSAITNYGDAGRKLYFRFLAADFIFIPIYSIAFALLMTRIIRAAEGEGGAQLLLNMLPFGIGLFDLLENFCILGMLGIYPDMNVILGTLSGTATSCKYLLTLTAILSLFYYGLVLLMRRLGARLCQCQRQ